MVLIVIRHPVRPELADAFPETFDDFTTETRAEPGNVSFEWSRSCDDRNAYFLVEVFRDAAASAAHIETDHFKMAIARMPGLLAGPPEIIHADIPGSGWSRVAEIQVDAS